MNRGAGIVAVFAFIIAGFVGCSWLMSCKSCFCADLPYCGQSNQPYGE